MGKTPTLKESPRYDIKPFDSEETCEMWSSPSLPLLRDPTWLGVVAPDRVLFMGQIELFDYLNCVQTNDWC